MNFMNVELIGETNDIKCSPTRENTVIKIEHDVFKLVDNATWNNWKMAIVFPDKEKAHFFIHNFKRGMSDYREGMLKDDYVVHIIHFKYPKPEKLYADQIKMTSNFSFNF